jgi:chromosome segregation protein
LRVKSLQITGFKSFVDKTAFSFRPGITAIVGPNGCGKSNLVDAIRWAMGEQSPRRLRGKGMEDVIFAGSDARSPVGLSEVVLTFDNGDGSGPPQLAAFGEIQIARRLYRSGEAEYLINKVPCRLRDVYDFFRDTGIGTKGYTIVEQGRIAEIVSARPEERRVLIEEAAGIGKYKARRREAERKLQATEQNLVRVSDVLGEIKRQIFSIERQARKAARYKKLREIQRLLELSLAVDERQELLAEIEGARSRLASVHDAATAAEARLAQREAALENRRVDLAERERILSQGSEALFQLRGEIKESQSKIDYERRERASLQETKLAREGELESLLAKLRGSEEELQRIEDELRAVENSLADESRSMAAAESEAQVAEEALRGIDRERDAQSAALVEVLTRIARTEDRLAALEDRCAEIDRRLRSADEVLEVQQSEAAQVDREQHELEEGLRNLLAERDRLMGLLREALDRHGKTTEKLRLAAAKLGERRELRETRRARLASLTELLARREDVAEGARHLLSLGEEAKRAHGLRDLVRDVLEVEPHAERAVEAVLADRAEGLVVDRPRGAISALEALRGAGKGRGVFVLPPAAEEISRSFVPLGRPLLECVRSRKGYEGVARALLGGVNLVESLGEVVEIYGSGRLPCSFATPAGDVLTADGVVRGGGDASQAGILSRVREVRELEAEVAGLEAEVGECEREHREAELALARASDELDNLRNRHHTAALAVANHEKDLERTRERVKAIGEAQEGRVAERSEFLSEVESLGIERERLAAVLSAAREERIRRQRELDALGLQIGSAGREFSRLGAVVTERRVQHGARVESRDRLRGALERTRAAQGETREWIERREQEIRRAENRREALASSIEETERALAARLREEEAVRLTNEEKRDAYEEQAATVRALESEARDLRIELESQRDEGQQAELGLRERELRLEHLVGGIRDKWNVDLETWKPPVPVAGAEEEAAAPGAAAIPLIGEDGDERAADVGPPDVSPGGAEDRDARREAREIAGLLALPGEERSAQLDQVRAQVDAVGEVNLGAIEEHEELRERFRFLTEQKADLESSIAQLRDAISRINRTSRKRFRETFEAVNEKFQEVFPRMFRGGKASLSLTESDDVLEAGIEIMAQPPGKRLQSVNLLSGGEKAMTAIALLVSVFQVRPSPFFLLDEVDAALDDANVGRFNEIVKDLAESSQFLLITHNKRTIEVADVLYGVTMEEKGVSKLVAVELH